MGTGTRRRDLRVQRHSSVELDSQGEGTWVELGRKLTFEMVQPVIRLAGFRDDPRMQAGGENQVAALEELLMQFRQVLPPLIKGWNWLTEFEAEIARVTVDDDVLTVTLEAPLLGADLQPGQPIYVGQWPDDAQRFGFEALSPDGLHLKLRGVAQRSFAPGADYVLVGLLDPQQPGAFDAVGLEEMIWLVNLLAAQIQESLTQQQSRRHPKNR